MSCWCKGACPNEKEPAELLAQHFNGRAETMLRRILVDAPFCIRANEMMAEVLSNSNRAAFAQKHLDRAAADPDRLRYAMARGRSWRAQTELGSAIGAYRDAVAAEKKDPVAWEGLIGALEADGRIEEAAATCLEAQGTLSTNGLAIIRRSIASVKARQGHYTSAIAFLSNDDAIPAEMFDRGRYREAIGDYAGAWSDWMRAKQILRDRGGHAWNRDLVEAQIAGLLELTTDARLDLIMRYADTSIVQGPAPLFITGHPRSGTTMMEQVLASHSRVVAGDELAFIPELVDFSAKLLRAGVHYPACLMALAIGDNDSMASVMRNYYWTKAQHRIGFAPGWMVAECRHDFFTDKMPLNEIHLPLIRLMFPEAPIVYMRRHPLDIVVSNMSHFLTHGHHYAAALESCAEAYVLTDRLLQHYKRKFPGAMQEVRYEYFVADQKNCTDMVLGYCGLAPEDACYEFHKNPRRSRTISQGQIQQPLYDKSVGRFRNFLDQLAPIVELVRPICEREGYTI